MKNNPLSKSEYSSILKEIRSIYESSLQEGDSDWNKSILYGNWKIGKTIQSLETSFPESSTYGKQIIEELAKDLKSQFEKGFSPRNLWNFKKFHKLYPKAKINPILSWSHYSILITIDDPKKRSNLEKKAIQKKLTFRELSSLVKNADQHSILTKTNPDESLLKIPELKLHTYRIITPISNQPPLLDLGFSIYTSHPHPHAVRDADLRPQPSEKPFYTYKAFLKRVIDGDTIDVLVELGFSNYTIQRLRLKSIDTPELSTQQGMKAKDFVEKTLKDVHFLIIKTQSHDKYDRYLVDVFFLEGEVTEEDVIQNGRFLNQEILDTGMGVRW